MHFSQPARLVSPRFGLIGAALVFVAAGALKWNSGLMPAPVAVPAAPPPLKVNARDYYNRAGQLLLRDSNLLQQAFWPLAGVSSTGVGLGASVVLTPAQARHIVAENAPALAVVREGLGFPYREYAGTSPIPLVRDSDDELAALLALQGETRAARGDWSGAMGADLDCIEFGSSLQQGADLPSSREDYWREAAGRRNAWQAINHLNGAQAQAALARLTEIVGREAPYSAILRTQKSVTEASFLNLFSQLDWRSQLLMGSGIPYPSFSTYLLAHLVSPRSVYESNIRFQDELIRRSRLAWPEQRKLTSAPVPGDPFFAGLASYGLSSQLAQNNFTALNNMLLVTLALRAYRLERGAYPTSLSHLVPAYLPSMPMDPFSDGQPLKYRLAGGNPLLYSIGPDGLDNGGQPLSTKAQAAWRNDYPTLDSTGDLVAGSR